MNFEGIIYAKQNSQSTTYRVIPFIRNVWNNQIRRDRRWIHGVLGLGRLLGELRGVSAEGYRLLCGVVYVGALGLDGGGGGTTL